ncbi:hypothetical protein [Dyadobacter pollutisoli]|uniref:Uncharacterized protein n=1 Tax=Dyadobacter pollutisoli TaxID=2910158 RepID=A0A9E8NBB6_9BACT|nr:hypothetical protein [Dyadobacter pollutisoli]WAC11184.1 hypothetical protein ON006_26050 [Dyadobacter pollutisoli]
MNFAIIIILSVILQLFAPWWVIAIVPLIILFWRPATTSEAFWTGFAGIALPWLAYGYYLHFISEGAMSDRVAQIFFLPNGILILIVTALVGGLTGGLAGIAGHYVREVFRQSPVRISGRTS